MKTSAMLSKRFCISHKSFRSGLFALSIFFCGISGNGLAAPNLQPTHISTDEPNNAIQAGNCSATPITPGSIVSGTLSLTDCVSPFKNSAADRYTFNGTAGQKIAISLGSDSLDTYLYLIGPDGKVVAEDDDSGDGHNSRIPSTGFLRLSATGTYQIEATSYRSQVTGGYTLLLALGSTSCTYLPTATTESFTTYGGVGSLNVSTDPGCGWKTTSGVSWITIISGDGKTATGAVQIASAAPGLFSANSNGQGAATGVLLRIKADSSQSYESLIEFDSEHHQFVTVPIDFGDETDQLYLVLFGTGFRHYSNAGDAARITAQIGGVDAQIVFAGAQGELVGVDQLNLLLPRTVAGRGEVDVKLTVNSTTANVVKVNFK